MTFIITNFNEKSKDKDKDKKILSIRYFFSFLLFIFILIGSILEKGILFFVIDQTNNVEFVGIDGRIEMQMIVI